MRAKRQGQVVIECPNTIFHLYVKSENELSKIEIFMTNIRSLKKLSINDIYQWCNRQGINYNTSFNYHKDFRLCTTLRSYFQYQKNKFRFQYQLGFGAA